MMMTEYVKNGLMCWPIAPNPLPDLSQPGTFVVRARITKGLDYEDEVELECTCHGDGKFVLPVRMPTTLTAAAIEREARRAEALRAEEESRRRLEEELEEARLTPEEEAELAARAAEDERIAEAKRMVAEQRRRDELAWAERILEGGEPLKREAILREVKRVVFERDGGQCTECGSTFDLQYDHVIPLALGGSNSVENLQVLCGTCNQRKGASL